MKERKRKRLQEDISKILNAPYKVPLKIRKSAKAYLQENLQDLSFSESQNLYEFLSEVPNFFSGKAELILTDDNKLGFTNSISECSCKELMLQKYNSSTEELSLELK
jgi:hypothetical protein